jgi:hypothetical protein
MTNKRAGITDKLAGMANKHVMGHSENASGKTVGKTGGWYRPEVKWISLRLVEVEQ